MPLSVKDQIKESSGVLEGEVSEIKTELDGSLIISRVVLKVNGSIDIGFNQDYVSVYYPGGTLSGETQLYHGSPKFNIGEKVVLMTKKVKERNWIQGLGLGKFSLKKVGHKYILVNQIFPNHPQASQISLSDFRKTVSLIKKKKYNSRIKPKFSKLNGNQRTLLGKDGKGRKLASINTMNTRDKIESERLSSFWLLLFLGLFGFIFTYVRTKTND